MRIHLSRPAVAASLLLSLPSSSEAKLGAPRRSPLHDEQPNEQPNQQRLLPQNIATDPQIPSCHEHPGQFRYSTRTNGEILVSCSSLVVQLARGAVSSSKISNKCRQPLVGLEDWYGPDATVADACPGLCGRSCDGQNAPIIEQHEGDSNDIDVDQPDIIDEPMMELIEPTPIDDVMGTVEETPSAEDQPTSVVESTTGIIETILTQVEQELTESEDEEYGDMTPTIDLIAASEDEEEDGEEEYEKPTPTIASFGKLIYILPFLTYIMSYEVYVVSTE